MESVQLDGERRATYEVVGHGEPCLMFPGGPGFAASWMRNDAHLLADRFTSYLIDPHGSGGSTPPSDPAAYDHEGHARFYDEVRRALGLGSVSVLGSSFGGTVAITFAALFPEATSRCIAVGAFGMGTEVDEQEGGRAAAESEAAMARHVGAEWFEEAKATLDSWTERVLATEDAAEVDRMMATVLPMYCAHPDLPDVRGRLDELAKLIDHDLAAGKAWEGGLYQSIDLRPHLPKVQCPTLVVGGELDFICGPTQAGPLADGIADATLVLLPECGHLPSIEVPDRYGAAVLEWVAA